MLVLTGSQSQTNAAKDWDVDDVVTILEQSHKAPTLLLCRTGSDEHTARTIQGVFKRRDLGVLALDEPETRFRALAYCLTQLHPRAYGQAPMVVEALQPTLRTTVALTSVTKLTNPSPTIGQHLQSMMPGSRFALTLGAGQSRVSKVKAGTGPHREHWRSGPPMTSRTGSQEVYLLWAFTVNPYFPYPTPGRLSVGPR